MLNKKLYDCVILLALLTLAILIYYCRLKKRNENFLSPAPAPVPIPQLKDGVYPNVVQDLKDNYLDSYRGDGTYKRLPFKTGTRLFHQDLDESVLKNFRVNNFLNTHMTELTYPEMDGLLMEVTKKKDFKLDLDSKKIVKKNELQLDYIHGIILNQIVNLINLYFQKLKLESIYNRGDLRKYKMYRSQIISDTETEGLSANNRLLIYNITIYKENKHYHFVLQVTCLYNYIQNVISIDKIDIIGIQEQDKLRFNNLLNNKQSHCILDKDDSYNNKLLYCHPKKMKEFKQSLELYDKKFNAIEIKKFMEDKEKEKKEHLDYLKYKCFLKDGFNEADCLSYDFNKKTYGVWDKPCNDNTDCPFYKMNKNYKNTRGGCINGFCEMPKNIKRVGHRYYETNREPYCHNCDRKGCIGKECLTCCAEQFDKKKYPKLRSPDYMFHGDKR